MTPLYMVSTPPSLANIPPSSTKHLLWSLLHTGTACLDKQRHWHRVAHICACRFATNKFIHCADARTPSQSLTLPITPLCLKPPWTPMMERVARSGTAVRTSFPCWPEVINVTQPALVCRHSRPKSPGSVREPKGAKGNDQGVKGSLQEGADGLVCRQRRTAL